MATGFDSEHDEQQELISEDDACRRRVAALKEFYYGSRNPMQGVTEEAELDKDDDEVEPKACEEAVPQSEAPKRNHPTGLKRIFEYLERMLTTE